MINEMAQLLLMLQKGDVLSCWGVRPFD
uniref:Uncharacterized protein n=1 Tax=Arundo donax TaxID=35708 RepID=A0A0A9ACG7_ARUDO